MLKYIIMRKKSAGVRLPEIVFSSADYNISKQISNLIKDGQLRKLLPKVYTSNFEESDKVIVKRNLWMLLSYVFPNAILSHRSALEFQHSPKQYIYLTGNQRRIYKWPGITIRMVDGSPRLVDDRQMFENLYVSSLERALLENLSSARMVGGERRILSQSKIEERLLVELNTRGEEGLNKIRDRARAVSIKLTKEKAFVKLDQMIGSILSSRPSKILQSPIAVAQALGEPYDSSRMELFQQLIGELKRNSFKVYPEKTNDEKQFNLIAFFESYFSNYIEGTTFEIQEAKEIIYENKIILNRTGDTHDIRGTYQLVQNRFEMTRIAEDAEDFLMLLQRRHQNILKGRKEKNPGVFKAKANRAGDSYFVAPALVKGTLKYGFKLLGSLTNAFDRALFIMFLVSEVHPFDDGNGRLARIMMNVELVYGKQTKLIIPTVYREDYVLNLRKFTRQRESSGYIKMMRRAYDFSHWLEPNSYEYLLGQLYQSNAFRESDEANLKFP